MKRNPPGNPRPPVAKAIEIDLIQERQKAIAKRTKALNTELSSLNDEAERLHTRKLELLREFDSVTR